MIGLGAPDPLRRSLAALAVRMEPTGWRALRFLEQHQWDDPVQIEAVQREGLSTILDHAYAQVPYYHERFEKAGIVEGARVVTGRFADIPQLTKAIIRDRYSDLLTRDLAERRWVTNRTGGSTGEPLTVAEDRESARISGGAVLRWFLGWHGVHPGERQIQLWGSDRELFGLRQRVRDRARQFAMGSRLLNAFCMSPERMRAYIAEINRFRPRVVRGYSTSLYEVARFAEENGLPIRAPSLVVSSAGTLYPDMRVRIERAFGCKVFNHYGSREVHSVAMECPAQRGLHVSSFVHVVEVLDERGRACPPGVEGDLVVTSLTNLVMPLLRYRIGDRAIWSEERCPCGRGMPLLASVTGRSVNCFRGRDGQLVPGEFFVHLLGVFLKDTPFAKVQIVQEDLDELVVLAVLRPAQELRKQFMDEVTAHVRMAMGHGCSVRFERVSDIPTPPSGKYQYTICKLPGAAGAGKQRAG